MALTIIETPSAPAPVGAYSQVVAASGWVFTSGQVGVDPVTDDVPADFRDEVAQALANLQAVLEAAGSRTDLVVKTLCFVTDAADLAVFNEVYAAFFAPHVPARSTVGVSLPGGLRFEIEAIAERAAG